MEENIIIYCFIALLGSLFSIVAYLIIKYYILENELGLEGIVKGLL